MKSTLLALLIAALYTALIGVTLIIFFNHLWPLLPSPLKLVVCIVAAALALGPPYVWLIRKSDEAVRQLPSHQRGPDKKSGTPPE